VYEAVLSGARLQLSGGHSAILDGTWRDQRQRERARSMADETNAPMVEFTCSVPLKDASVRIQRRVATNSDATPEIAAALSDDDHWCEAYRINTGRPLADSVADAEQVVLKCLEP